MGFIFLLGNLLFIHIHLGDFLKDIVEFPNISLHRKFQFLFNLTFKFINIYSQINLYMNKNQIQNMK